MTFRAPVDVSVIIPALHEGPNLQQLLPALRQMLASLGIQHVEMLVVGREPDDETAAAVSQHGARLLQQREPGYGGALLEGFGEARGEFFLTMDADLSHRPDFVRDMWQARHDADVIIASRYVPGGKATMPVTRYVLSRILNGVFRSVLDLPIGDMSSGFRLYRAQVLRGPRERYTARDFDTLQQILLFAYADGWRIREVPFAYAPREHGTSSARLLRVGRAYLRTIWPLWRLRHSIAAADYDDRAHDSRIPLQRYRRRRRYRLLRDLVANEGPVLNVGLGSARLIAALPPGSVAVDEPIPKVRYARKYGRPVVHGSGLSLPFRDESFSCVLCSQVIQRVPKGSPILDELTRVLKPGGRLVLGTPDYGRWEWLWLEKAANVARPGYAADHIAHYTFDELMAIFRARGYTAEDHRYVLRGELLAAFRKPARASRPDAADGEARPAGVGMRDRVG